MSSESVGKASTRFYVSSESVGKASTRFYVSSESVGKALLSSRFWVSSFWERFPGRLRNY